MCLREGQVGRGGAVGRWGSLGLAEHRAVPETQRKGQLVLSNVSPRLQDCVFRRKYRRACWLLVSQQSKGAKRASECAWRGWGVCVCSWVGG